MQLEDVAFLVRSPNRVAVLSALVEEPCDRRTLRETVGASRVTVGRIVSDLEDRGWVRREGTDYVATTAGRVVDRSVDDLLATLTATDALDSVLEHLPIDAFDFDIRELADAEVVVPTPAEPTAHVDRLTTLFSEASDVSMVAHSMTPSVVAANYERVIAGEQCFDAIVTPDVVEAVRTHDEVASMVAEMFAVDGFRFHQRETVPLQFGVFDGTTAISVDDGGIPKGVAVSDSAAVERWGVDTLERLRAEATPVGPFTV